MSVPQPTERLPICVYMASRHGNRIPYTTAARRLAGALADHGCDLVYGGGSVGLMGEVATTVLDAGGAVTGVITQHLYDLEVAHSRVTELIVVPDMQTRKRAMFDRSEAFIVLPGGVGTMEELFEVWCWASLGLHPKVLGLLNVDGYYDHLCAFMQRSVDDGLTNQATIDLLIVDDDPVSLVEQVLDRIDPEAAAS